VESNAMSNEIGGKEREKQGKSSSRGKRRQCQTQESNSSNGRVAGIMCVTWSRRAMRQHRTNWKTMGLRRGLTRETHCAGTIVLSVMRHRDPVGWDLKGDQAACLHRCTPLIRGCRFRFRTSRGRLHPIECDIREHSEPSKERPS